MSNLKKAVYFGYSINMMKSIINSTQFDLIGVVYSPKRVEKSFLDTVASLKINKIEINSKPDFNMLYDFCSNADVVIMYKFEFIIPFDFIDKMTIVNFHGGDLRSNRGAHAVIWSILNCEKQTCLSMYKLIGGIDEGELIEEKWVNINDDTPESLNLKLQRKIPCMLKSLYEYLNGNKKTTLIINGKYRPKIKEKDYTIDIYNDPINMIKAKIRSQISYSGAVLVFDNSKYRVISFLQKETLYTANRKIKFENLMFIIDEKRIQLLLQVEKVI